jgi:nickel transport protein
MTTRLLVVLAAAAGVAALAPTPARAHALDVTVKAPPGAPAVKVEVGFDDGTPAEKAEVVVADSGGAVVAKGATDETGVWAFATPAAGKYVATVEAVGHRTRVEFEVTGAATPAGEVAGEFTGWRPDRTLGVALGVGGLLLASAGFWWLRLRKSPAAG